MRSLRFPLAAFLAFFAVALFAPLPAFAAIADAAVSAPVAVAEWLKSAITLFGLTAPAWMWIVVGLLLLVEHLLGKSKSIKPNSLVSLITDALKAVLSSIPLVNKLAKVPVIGDLIKALGLALGSDPDPATSPASSATPPAAAGGAK